MALTGKQFKQIQDALLSGYNGSSLRQMVRFGMDESLDEIAPNTNLRDRIFDLIEWAIRADRVQELVQAAYEHNSTNSMLKTLHNTWFPAESPSDAVLSPDTSSLVPPITQAGVGTAPSDSAESKPPAAAHIQESAPKPKAPTFIRQEDADEYKRTIIHQMTGPDNDLALAAVRAARIEGWLTDGSLQNANLVWANLEDAALERADLRGAILTEVNLRGAVLIGANLRRAYLIRGNLQLADLRDADLEEANLQGTRLQEATYNSKTIWPKDFDPIAAGAILVNDPV
jgi:hypothetical protein